MRILKRYLFHLIHHRKLLPYVFLFFGGYGIFFSVISITTILAQSVPCHIFTSNQEIPSSAQTTFGAAYNLFSDAKEVLLKAGCSPSGVSLEVGSGAANELVYRYAYIWINNQRQQVPLSGQISQYPDYVKGPARGTVNATPEQLRENQFYIAFTCTETAGQQKCGCRDTTCAQNYWQIQGIRYDGATGGGSSGPGPVPAGGSGSSGGSSAQPSSSSVPQGYRLVFSDEFNGTSVDTGKWIWGIANQGITHYGHHGELQRYTKSGRNGVLSNGTLTLLGKQDMSSEAISAKPRFKHGYFEARIKLNASKSTWAAYWLTSDSRWPPEWDIFEIVNDPTTVHQYAPRDNTTRNCSNNGMTKGKINTNDGFHIYGFHWTSNRVIWTVDGQETRHCDVLPGWGDDYMWLIHNLAFGGGWPGSPNNTTIWPQTFIMDYTRVYQGSDGAIREAVGNMVDPASPK